MSKSKMDVSGASIYFWLLVFNLYVGNLSVRAVETSTFFLQFCMLRIAQSCPLELIHPPFHLGFLVKTIVHRLRWGLYKLNPVDP
jgi:hypothetical protein